MFGLQATDDFFNDTFYFLNNEKVYSNQHMPIVN